MNTFFNRTKIMLFLMICLSFAMVISTAYAASDIDTASIGGSNDLELEQDIDVDNIEITALDDNKDNDASDVDNVDDENESIEVDNETESVEVDNATEPVDGDGEVVIDNSTEKKDLKPYPVVTENKNQSKWRSKFYLTIPEVEVHPPKISTGNKIDDAVVYYSVYYKAFKDYYDARPSCDSVELRSMDSLIGLVYQSYDENETMEIVSKVVYSEEFGGIKIEGIASFMKSAFESAVYNKVQKRFHFWYTDPNEPIKPKNSIREKHDKFRPDEPQDNNKF